MVEFSSLFFVSFSFVIFCGFLCRFLSFHFCEWFSSCLYSWLSMFYLILSCICVDSVFLSAFISVASISFFCSPVITISVTLLAYFFLLPFVDFFYFSHIDPSIITHIYTLTCIITLIFLSRTPSTGIYALYFSHIDPSILSHIFTLNCVITLTFFSCRPSPGIYALHLAKNYLSQI